MNISRSISKIKKKADSVFSTYIRNKYAVNGYVMCVTCGILKPPKKMQAGHYIPRNILSTRYYEKNVHPQCYGCNVCKNGAKDNYALYLISQYGDGILEELAIRKNMTVKFTYTDYEEMIRGWKCQTE